MTTPSSFKDGSLPQPPPPRPQAPQTTTAAKQEQGAATTPSAPQQTDEEQAGLVRRRRRTPYWDRTSSSRRRGTRAGSSHEPPQPAERARASALQGAIVAATTQLQLIQTVAATIPGAEGQVINNICSIARRRGSTQRSIQADRKHEGQKGGRPHARPERCRRPLWPGGT